MTELSASQVNRAGKRVRRHARGEDVDSEALRLAYEILVTYRTAHARSLQTATMGLRSAVETMGYPIRVSQRLKRVPTIIDKLKREPTLALSRMQYNGRDIELQLRTPLMHVWALETERLIDIFGLDFKAGWNQNVNRFLALVSYALAVEEVGGSVSVSLKREIDRQRILTNVYLRERQ